MLAFLLLILELLLSFVTPLVLSVTIDSVIGSAPLSAPWYFTWLLSLCGGLSFIRSHMIIMSILIVVMALLSGLLSCLRPGLCGLSYSENAAGSFLPARSESPLPLSQRNPDR